VGENLGRLIRWLSSLHAPLGRWAPLAGSVLFAGAGLSHSSFLRTLAYSGAAVFVALIAADIARSFIDGHSFPDRSKHPAQALTLPMLGVRILLTAFLGAIYTSLVFIGVGPWTPFIFLPVIFIACCFVAWRNISLWYEQGEEFEEALAEAEQNHHSRLPQIPDHRAH
jgi:Na+/H+ antiporter NhaC